MPDGAAPKDEFESHTHIANGIKSLIEGQEGGQVVGLRGPFGSGKTTTVSELEKLLGKNWHTVTFDAWTHQGDNLNRAFLVTLLAKLKGPIPGRVVERKKEDLVHEVKRTQTVTEGGVNKWGQITASLAILATVITTGLRAMAQFPEARTGPWLDYSPKFFLILAWLPWFILLATVAIGFFGPWPKRVEGEKPGPIIRLCDRIKWMRWVPWLWSRGVFGLSFFTKGERVTSSIQAAQSANSLTFQDEFGKIITMATARDHKVLIVFDNLDRLDEQAQKGAWSTVEAFVQADFEAKTNVWFLVPLSTVDHHEIVANDDGHNVAQRAALREKLADKLFLTEFRVPEIVLTDWVKYIETLSGKVLHNLPTEQQNSVRDVMVAWFNQQKRRPRPREIRAIVNQVGGLWHQWRDEIDVGIICLYILVIQELERAASTLDDEAILSDFKGKPGRNSIPLPSIREDLAMLHFSAKRKKALQVLVNDTFTTILTVGQRFDSEHLEIERVEDLISDVATKILQSEHDGGTVLRMAKTLGETEDKGHAMNKRTWDALARDLARQETVWSEWDPSTITRGAKYLQSTFADPGDFEDAMNRQLSIMCNGILRNETKDDEDD